MPLAFSPLSNDLITAECFAILCEVGSLSRPLPMKQNDSHPDRTLCRELAPHTAQVAKNRCHRTDDSPEVKHTWKGNTWKELC